tara:strand:- start:5216 stop:5557 length:342 start_codon:yes stop_codon:yes gene_type:complete
MKLNKTFIVQSSDKLSKVIEKILVNTHRTVFVLKKKKLIGVISEGDILRALLAKKNLETFSEAIMNKTFIYLTKDNQSKAAVYFRKHLVPIIPIINKKMEIIKFLTLEKFLSK